MLELEMEEKMEQQRERNKTKLKTTASKKDKQMIKIESLSETMNQKDDEDITSWTLKVEDERSYLREN